MEYGAFYVICPRASSQYVTPLPVTLTLYVLFKLCVLYLVCKLYVHDAGRAR